MFSTFNSVQSFLIYFRNRVSGLAPTFIYNFPALDPSLVLYYPLDSSANVGGGFQTANFASKLPVFDASLAGSSMITYALNNSVTSFGDLSLNNTMGAQLVAQTVSGNYVVSNTTFAPNISGGFSISLWFSCSGQLNKTGTLISLPYQITGNGIQIDISGTNMIYTGWNNNISSIINFYTNPLWLDTGASTNFTYSSGSNIATWIDRVSISKRKTVTLGSKGGAVTTFVSPSNGITLPTNSPISSYQPTFNTFFLTSTAFNIGINLQTFIYLFSPVTNMGSDGNNRIILLGSAGGTNNYAIQIIGSSIYVIGIGNGVNQGYRMDYTPTFTANTRYLLSVSINTSSPSTSTMIFRLNGTLQTTIQGASATTYSMNGNSNGMNIGAFTDYAGNIALKIYEILATTGQNMTTNDIKSIENYLNQKWNLGFTIT
jgi:hypothetical protein